MVATVSHITRSDIEDFLYEEAALLDEWRLREWLALTTEDATYEVPSTDVPDGDPRDTLFIIADNAIACACGSINSSANRPGPKTRRPVRGA
jgi:p-cumate 2,3-dioxygenase beta subunit